MKNAYPLFLIYDYANPAVGEEEVADESSVLDLQGEKHYRITYFFSDQEDLSWNDLKLQYQSVFMKESDDHLGIGPFQNISDLHRFGLSLGEKIGSPQVYFHSVFDYNQMVEQVFDIAGFKKSLLAGHMIETNKNKGTNSSFFGRIFKDS
ncbi:MAG: hypothetical protein HOE90_19955 [Bacteriovoracaceae bacterium]|nr:hypothetical protein [Bacteriovoracaceae bacterium]